MKAAIAAILTVIIMSLTASSGAQIYKCTDEHGNVRFSTKPGPGCKLEAGSVSSGVICNKFDVNAKRTGSTLHISLSTDLPDDTIIMVSISRSYWEKGKETEYAQDYFSGKSTVGEWRKWHKFEIYNEKWVLNLQRHRKKLSRISLGFGIDYISDNIRVRMIVPINQKNAQFGKGNVNLSGSAVETDGLRVIRGEKDLYYPVNSMEKVKRRFPSLDPLNLEIGQMYIIEKKTPLMPTHSPKDVLNALKYAKAIPKGKAIKILKIYEKNGNPWYQVLVTNRQKQFLATGWINGTALLGQNLEILP